MFLYRLTSFDSSKSFSQPQHKASSENSTASSSNPYVTSQTNSSVFSRHRHIIIPAVFAISFAVTCLLSCMYRRYKRKQPISPSPAGNMRNEARAQNYSIQLFHPSGPVLLVSPAAMANPNISALAPPPIPPLLRFRQAPPLLCLPAPPTADCQPPSGIHQACSRQPLSPSSPRAHDEPPSDATSALNRLSDHIYEDAEFVTSAIRSHDSYNSL